MNQSQHYEYADGSANRYIITSDSIEYIPVKPEESSSGMYSGGTPKAMSLTTEQFKKLRAALEKAINNPTVHIKDRIKMSGVISVLQGENRKEYILSPASPERLAIEGSLKELLGN